MIWFDSLAKPPSPQRIPPFAFRLAIPAALREVLFVLSILRSHPPGNAEPQLGSHSYSLTPARPRPTCAATAEIRAASGGRSRWDRPERSLVPVCFSRQAAKSAKDSTIRIPLGDPRGFARSSSSPTDAAPCLAPRAAVRYAGRMNRQFEDLRASELYCPRCKVARPVREKLLLVLPHAELHDYRCTTCNESLGSREVKAAPVAAVPPAARRSAPRQPPARQRGLQRRA